jgi:orotate phosphoribosyltransferase
MSVLALVSARRGHFLMESGYHGALWFDLDALFASPQSIAPLVARLADALRPHDAEVVCGPLVGGAFLAQAVAGLLGAEFWFTERIMPPEPRGLFAARYRLPPALASRAQARRVAIVDDVMSAGSALRGTYRELLSHGAIPVVAGALMVLGSPGADFFAAERIPVETLTRDEYQAWPPDDCPLCAAGVPLDRIG